MGVNLNNIGYVPLNYEQINIAAGTYIPSQVKSFNNLTFQLWQRALFQRACSTLVINLPKEWRPRRDFFFWCLFAYGFMGVGYMPELGNWFNPGALSGFDFYYQPTRFSLTNPYLNNVKQIKRDKALELEIHKDCEIIKLTPDFRGIWDVITYYAEKLATIDVAINTAIINSKFAYIVGAKNKAAAEVLKKLFDKVNSGEPAVFFDKKLANDGTDKEEPWQVLFRDDLKNDYIVTALLQDFQTVINDFDTEVGIPTLPYFKKERMVTGEANSKQIDAMSRSIVWFDTLKNTMEIANEFLKLKDEDKLRVTLRYEEEGGEDDGNSEADTDRAV